jgi:tetratricopeptide (TPR) repeat protein/tRNA A-37 threonylcarbamoyl transferase component Bud32
VTDPTLDPDRWQRVQTVFHAALEHDPDKRERFLEEACGDDHSLRAEVASLLEAHQADGMLTATDRTEDVRLILLREAVGDRYEVLREVGSGGMATVYLARDRKHNRDVAIKLLPPELAATLGGERFLREIEIAAGLQHPHILPLYDSGGAGTVIYYVMPYVEGETLSDRLERGALRPKEAIQIAKDVLSALEYAHRRGIVHRDIKPANILLSASGGHALVADFGIARAVSAAGPEKLTMTGAMIGTPGYMAPEQAVGAEITPATDVYAAGVVLYECLTGRRWTMAQRLQDCDWSGVPPGVMPALKKALAWLPEDRWSDAGQFRDGLLRASSVLKATTVMPGHRLLNKRRMLVAAAAAIVLVVVLAVAGVLPTGRSPAVATVTRVAVLPFTVRGSEEFAYLGDGLVDLLSTKLDGAGNWRSVDPRLVLGVTEREGSVSAIDPVVGHGIAERLDADLYLLGSVVQLGAQLRLDASLYDVRAGPDAVTQASVEGPVDDLLDLLDGMAAELLAADPDAAGARLSQIALVTSSSLPALKAYLRGVTHLRAAQYQEAAEAFQSAIAADSTFALAWYQLGIAADWLLDAELGRESTIRALRYADRLSQRDRRLLEARGAVVVDADATEAERLYRAIVGTYPADVEAWSQLGELISHWGSRNGMPLDAAREPWIRLLALEPDRADALVHLARIEAAAQDAQALDAVAQRAAELTPEGDRLLELRLLQAHVRGDVAARERVLADLRSQGDGMIFEVLWSAGSFLDDPSVAGQLAGILVEDSRSSDTRALGYGALASIAMAQGRWNAASDALDAMAEIKPLAALEQRTMLEATSVAVVEDSSALVRYVEQLRNADWTSISPAPAPGVWFTALEGLHSHLAQYLIGLASARVGDTEQALAAAAALERMGTPDGQGSLVHDWASGVRATVAWRSGNVAEALGEIEHYEGRVFYQLATGSLFHTLAYERYLHARLLEESGRFEEALRWYGSFKGSGASDLIFLAPSHWRRGHIYRQMGDNQAARTHYQRALELWNDADDVFLPILEEIRRQLATLSG